MKRSTKRKSILAIALLLLIGTSVAFGSSDFLHVAKTLQGTYYQYNEKGVSVEPTAAPVKLLPGWVVITGEDGIVLLEGPFGQIRLQPKSLMAVGSLKAGAEQFYLVSGSANFLVEASQNGTMTILTPASRFTLAGLGELFVTSDVSEIVFALAGDVEAYNTITGRKTVVKEFSYLDMADPFVNQKNLSRQTYERLTLQPQALAMAQLPMPSVEEVAPSQVAPPPVVVAEVPSVVVTPEPIAKEPTEVVAKPVVVEPVKPVVVEEEVPVAVVEVEAVPVVEVKVEVPPVVVAKETFDVYIAHTGDIRGQIEEGIGIGFAKLATGVKVGRELGGYTLLLDAGNATAGSELAEHFAGEPVAALFDLLGYDAVAVGAEDFAYGEARLREGAALARDFSTLKVLSANALNRYGEFVFDPYALYDFNGFTIAVVGLTAPVADSSLTFISDEIIEYAQYALDVVREDADFVVLLGSLGTVEGLNVEFLAENLDGIDLIIEGSGYDAPAGGRLVGDTLIVSVDEGLASLGVVQVAVEDGKAVGVYAARIAASDVKNPAASPLAQAFGIDYIPADEEVASYISAVKGQLDRDRKAAAAKAAELEVVIAEPIAVATVEPPLSAPEAPTVVIQEVKKVSDVVVETAKVEEVPDPLTIKKPQGIVAAPDSTAQGGLEVGLDLSFHYNRFGSFSEISSATQIALLPYLKYNAFSIGLRAFYEWPQGANYLNVGKLDFSSVLQSYRSILSFVDYVKYGSQGDLFYARLDRTSPISFGNAILVDNYASSARLDYERVSFYGEVNLPRFKAELFFDDLALIENEQFAGLEVTFIPSIGNFNFEVGLSSLFRVDFTNQKATAYPFLNFKVPLKDNRKFGLSLFVNAGTALTLAPFSTTSVYNNGELQNLLVAGGLEMRTLDFDLRLIGAFQKNEDETLNLGYLNSSFYSRQRQVAKSATGYHWMFSADARYHNESLSAGLSYSIPLDASFTSILPLANNASVNGDRFTADIAYQNDNLKLSVGLSRYGFSTALKKVIAFSGGSQGLMKDLVALLYQGQLAEPFASLEVSHGLVTFGAEATVATNGLLYRPQLHLFSSIAVNSKSLDEMRSLRRVEPSESAFNVGLTSQYMTTLGGSSNRAILFVTPEFGYTSPAFSLVLGPRIGIERGSTIRLADWYTLSNSHRFSFGRGELSRKAQFYDIVSDTFALIERISVGRSDSAFTLEANRSMTYSSGTLIHALSAQQEAPYANKLALQSKFTSKIIGVELFVNDLENAQLGNLSIALTPFKKWAGGFELSVASSALLSSSEIRFDLFPSLALVVPIVDKERLNLTARGSFTTMLGVSDSSGGVFKQMLYNPAGANFLSKLNNYLLTGELAFEFGQKFSTSVTAAIQKGVVSYNMFDHFFMRNRPFLLNQFAGEWVAIGTSGIARTYLAAVEAGYQSTSFGLHGEYRLPFSASFAPQFGQDYLAVEASWQNEEFSVATQVARTGFLGSVKKLSAGTLSVKDLLLSGETMATLSAALTQKKVTLTATSGIVASYKADPATFNGYTFTDTVAPAKLSDIDVKPLVAFEVKVNLF